jgi:hypothetical protein
MAIGHKERVKEGQKPTPTRVFSKKQETAIAKATGGQRTPNSGATPWSKGDVLTEQFLLEAKTKTTHSESISVKKEWFTKNRQEMVFMGKPYSAVVINFGPGEENYYVIDEYLFQELLEYLKTKEN